MHKADRPDNEGRVVSAPPIECLLYGTASCMSCRTAPTPLNGSQRTTNMKASRLTTVLENLLDQPWAAFIWGAPGIGKSSIVRQIAERRRMPLIDIRASLLDPTDLRGIPMIQDGTAVWCPPSFLPKKSDKPGILFLDEINAAPPLVQAALYQLILDRRVGEYELPEGWRIIAAGNRREDKAVTFRLSSALANASSTSILRSTPMTGTPGPPTAASSPKSPPSSSTARSCCRLRPRTSRLLRRPAAGRW